MDYEALYQQLADGEDIELPPRSQGTLMRAARDKAMSKDVNTRLGALRVAACLSLEYGLPVTEMLVNDTEIKVRRYAFNQAIAARYDGLPLIRRFAQDADPGIAAEAIDLLVRSIDMQSTPLMRRLLRSPHVKVRVGAATLLGHVAGPSVRVDLMRTMREDDDDAVKKAADDALKRMAGELPKNSPVKWWDGEDEEPEESLPPPPPIQEFSSLVGSPPPPVQKAVEEALAAERAAATKEKGEVADQAVVDQAYAEKAAEKAAAEPQLPATTPPEVDNRAEESDVDWASLPSELPDEAGALIKLLGMVGPDDRAVVIERLRLADAGELSAFISSARVTNEPNLARGIALAAAALQRSNWLVTVRRFVFDADPGVRSAAAEAIGALSGPSGIPSLTTLLGDGTPRVRASALRALQVLCANVNRADIVRNWAQQLSGDSDADVKAVAEAVLADLA